MAFDIPVRFIQRFGTLRYAVAVLAVGVAVGLRLALDPLLGFRALYLPFMAGVLVTGYLGGRGPALAATELSGVGVWYFFGDHLSAGASGAALELGFFLTTSTAVSMLATPKGRLFGGDSAAASPCGGLRCLRDAPWP